MTERLIGLFIAPVTPLQQNCTVVWCTKTMHCAIIDPGGDIEPILAEIKRRGLTVEKIWVTHGHADHAGATQRLKALTGVPIEGPHKDDSFWIERIPEDAKRYGLEGADRFDPDRWLDNDDEVTLGETVWQVIHCPGHTPGHVVFYHPQSHFAQVGDVLFQGSIGRTDFPRGNHADLLHAITERLWPLVDRDGGDVQFVCGHGPMSSFLRERQSNPFVGDKVIAHAKVNTSGPG
jgi:hydroxyacylglutathione hydrolase